MISCDLIRCNAVGDTNGAHRDEKYTYAIRIHDTYDVNSIPSAVVWLCICKWHFGISSANQLNRPQNKLRFYCIHSDIRRYRLAYDRISHIIIMYYYARVHRIDTICIFLFILMYGKWMSTCHLCVSLLRNKIANAYELRTINNKRGKCGARVCVRVI